MYGERFTLGFLHLPTLIMEGQIPLSLNTIVLGNHKLSGIAIRNQVPDNFIPEWQGTPCT